MIIVGLIGIFLTTYAFILYQVDMLDGDSVDGLMKLGGALLFVFLGAVLICGA